MLTEMSIPKNILSTFVPFVPPVLSAHVLSDRTPFALTSPLTKEFINVTPYPESAAQRFISLLDIFMGVVNRNQNLSRAVITETEYQQFSEIMDDLIYSVSDDKNHPLSASMTLIGDLIKMYKGNLHFPLNRQNMVE